MKAALLLLVLAACKHDRPSAAPPSDSEAIHEARAALELVAPRDPKDLCTLFWRADLLPPNDPAASDIGDFIGRLQTLFGPTPDHEYTLRDKATGLVITASAIADGPAFRGQPDPDDAAYHARIAADPVLAHGPPADPHDMDSYQRHAEIARSGPAMTALVTRLSSLIDRVPPADWEMTDYVHSLDGVFHLGAAHGKSFATALPADQSLAFLLDRAEKAPAGTEADLHAIEFYLGHQGQLASARPRVVALFRRFESAANARTDEGMLQIAEGWRRGLHL